MTFHQASPRRFGTTLTHFFLMDQPRTHFKSIFSGKSGCNEAEAQQERAHHNSTSARKCANSDKALCTTRREAVRISEFL